MTKAIKILAPTGQVTFLKTPRIDRMAKEGILLTDFYGQTVCGPSRAALMTGSYPLRVATERNRVDVHPTFTRRKSLSPKSLNQLDMLPLHLANGTSPAIRKTQRDTHETFFQHIKVSTPFRYAIE